MDNNKLIKYDFIDGIREIFIGLTLVISPVFIIFSKLVIVTSLLTIIIAAVIENLREKFTYPVIGYYKVKENRQKDLILAVIFLPLMLILIMLITPSIAKRELIISMFEAILSETYVNLLINISFFILFIVVNTLIYFLFKYTNTFRIKMLLIYSIISGLLAFLLSQEIVKGLVYMVFLGIGFLVSGIVGFYLFMKNRPILAKNNVLVNK